MHLYLQVYYSLKTDATGRMPRQKPIHAVCGAFAPICQPNKHRKRMITKTVAMKNLCTVFGYKYSHSQAGAGEPITGNR